MNRTSVAGNMPKRFSFADFAHRNRKIITEIISALFILLFVYTALSKLFNIESFRFVLGRSPLIEDHAAWIAWVLPITEILVSLLLFIPATRRWGLLSSLILMVGFTLYLSYMIVFTPDRPCSCGGVLSQMTWNQHLLFNLFFTILAFAGILLNRKHRKT